MRIFSFLLFFNSLGYFSLVDQFWWTFSCMRKRHFYGSGHLISRVPKLQERSYIYSDRAKLSPRCYLPNNLAINVKVSWGPAEWNFIQSYTRNNNSIEKPFNQLISRTLQSCLLLRIILEPKEYRPRATRVDALYGMAYLAKLLNAADCGFMQSGTRDVFSCSAINLCISSETDNDVPACKWMTEAGRW